jgi:hypothetical protein
VVQNRATMVEALGQFGDSAAATRCSSACAPTSTCPCGSPPRGRWRSWATAHLAARVDEAARKEKETTSSPPPAPRQRLRGRRTSRFLPACGLGSEAGRQLGNIQTGHPLQTEGGIFGAAGGMDEGQRVQISRAGRGNSVEKIGRFGALGSDFGRRGSRRRQVASSRTTTR